GTDAEAVNREILAGLENGLGAIRLGVGANGVPVADLPTAVRGLLFELAPLALSAGADIAAAATALYGVLDGYSAEQLDRADIRVSLGAAPLTGAFSGDADTDLA